MPFSRVFPLAGVSGCVPHSFPPFVTNTVMQMRVPYKKLIKEFADSFFSDPVLCTMAESIETLDRNDKYAKEKDVFQNKKYREHLKEANDKKEADEKKEALEVIKKVRQKMKKADATAAEGSVAA
eukprot:scaffold35009_cov51-Phaeocystis_antarctica.AAC.1